MSRRSRRAAARRFTDFMRGEAAGGVLLVLASLAALAIANSAWAPAYTRLLGARVSVRGVGIAVEDFVNDGLMALFFLLAGLEIRREMTHGRLASLRGMAAPGIAAIGGMAVPALIYLALNHADAATARGWAVPVATDIAFSLAVLRLVGERASRGVRVFLTALAILDDLGAIGVIALFYSRGLALPMLAASAALCVALLVVRRAGVQRLWPYLAGGALLWILVYDSGVHATLAGVALAFLLPRQAAARLERGLGGVVSYVVLPLFGLANGGLAFHTITPGLLLTPGPLGVFLGLCVGKQVGVFGATMLGRWAGVLKLPPNMGVRQLYGASLLCGIGFTMSLFIGNLAFREAALHDGIKLAVLCGSIVSALMGALVLRMGARKQAVLF